MDKDLTELPIDSVRGIGPQRAKLFSRIGILTVLDALFYLPLRYEDRTALKKIADIGQGGIETVQGAVVFANTVRTRKRNFRIFEISISDGTGFLKAKWFNQTYLQKNFPVGREVILSGIVKKSGQASLEMDSPDYEAVSDSRDSCIHTKRIVPVYSLTGGIGQKQFRKLMFGLVNACVPELHDHVPADLIRKYNLPPLGRSIMQLHFPEADADLEALNKKASIYHERLVFDELFLFELGLASLRRRTRFRKGVVTSAKGSLRKKYLENLSFALTEAQKRVIEEIRKDMSSSFPMNRLLQGDVGSGKTVIAFLAMLDAVEAGYQAVLMAPTEILASQHFINLSGPAKELGLKMEFLAAGSTSGADRIASGRADVVIGTHALIQEGIKFRKLGLAVIDEQHKFGVMQRALLSRKGINPDMLVMTATPIPRSLALTLYGDLDCSVIDELPSGRKPVSTVMFEADRKEEIYRLLRKELETGRRAYVVYPAIDESGKSELRNAVRGKEGFEAVFPEYRTGMIHGRMGTDEREEVMRSFRQGRIDILVSTTVIEVGLDVPDATIMLIINAERFGLAQLHQLRGRVGRGAYPSVCVLVCCRPYGEDAGRRLDVMLRGNDGFLIAEEDLKIRGPGEFFGTRQAGLPDLKVANIVRDMKTLERAKHEAFSLIAESPELKEFPSLKKTVEVFWKGKSDLFSAG
jgi:ATP-dependent DNA helicase RecG